MIILGLAALGTLCIAYGFLIEPYWLEVTHVRIESPRIPKLSRPIRIVHISDIHSEPRPRLEGRLPAVIAAEKPDRIVFTGDALNSPAGLPVFRECLTRIARVAPTFAVRGNWDRGTGATSTCSEGREPTN
jgi:predicted MPP superfamily phosphohydrolase